MGTAKSLPTPAGGGWTPVKGEIREFFATPSAEAANGIVSRTLDAAGGLSLPQPRIATGAEANRGAAGHGRGGGSGASAGTSRLGRALLGLAGFGAAIASSGFDVALERIGLGALRGRPAAEIVASIAEGIGGFGELQAELLSASLRDAIYEAVAAEGDPDAVTLAESLETYIAREGPEGLAQLFLTDYVYRRVWSLIEQYVEARTGGGEPMEALSAAVREACAIHIKDAMDDERASGVFNHLDWFGDDGVRHAERIISELENRLRDK